VTFCILLLEEQGKLDLDDRIQKFLPDFPEYGTPLTIRHFIHHISGVRDYLTLMNLMGKSYLDHIEEEEVYEIIKRQKVLNFTPGDQYLYSNSCYFMLAMIIEEAAGQSLKDFAAEHIFQPLGMSHTQFYDDNTDLIKNRVFSYEKLADEEGFDNLISRFDLVGSGGVYSSVEDLFLWDQNFYDNKLGKGGQEIIQKMHEEGLLNNGESCGYAFALVNGEHRGLKTVSHGGSLAGYRAHFLRFPEQHFSVIILANRSDANPGEKAYRVADIFLRDEYTRESEVEELVSGVPESRQNGNKTDQDISGIDLAAYTGRYHSRELDTDYLLYVEDEVLKVKIGSDKPKPLVPYDEDIFSVEEEGFSFRFSKDTGQITGFELDAGRVRGLAFEKE
jgi:CubicO group peptidase (beta-lactamase class C family)